MAGRPNITSYDLCGFYSVAINIVNNSFKIFIIRNLFTDCPFAFNELFANSVTQFSFFIGFQLQTGCRQIHTTYRKLYSCIDQIYDYMRKWWPFAKAATAKVGSCRGLGPVLPIQRRPWINLKLSLSPTVMTLWRGDDWTGVESHQTETAEVAS